MIIARVLVIIAGGLPAPESTFTIVLVVIAPSAEVMPASGNVLLGNAQSAGIYFVMTAGPRLEIAPVRRKKMKKMKKMKKTKACAQIAKNFLMNAWLVKKNTVPAIHVCAQMETNLNYPLAA